MRALISKVWLELADGTYSLIPFKQHHPTPFVTRREVVAGMIELDG